MWEQYVEKARQESAALGERALEVRYEDLLTQPERVIPAVAKFCRVPAPARHGRCSTASSRAEPSRIAATPSSSRSPVPCVRCSRVMVTRREHAHGKAPRRRAAAAPQHQAPYSRSPSATSPPSTLRSSSSSGLRELQAEGGSTAVGLDRPVARPGAAASRGRRSRSCDRRPRASDARHPRPPRLGLRRRGSAAAAADSQRGSARRSERVLTLELEMVTLARQHHDDIRMLPIFRELADDRSDRPQEVPRRRVPSRDLPRLLLRRGTPPL